MRQAYRQEHDSLGELPVPAEAYYGCQTLRALESYAITGDPISKCPKGIVMPDKRERFYAI